VRKNTLFKPLRVVSVAVLTVQVTSLLLVVIDLTAQVTAAFNVM
jgi:hypothetical protein